MTELPMSFVKQGLLLKIIDKVTVTFRKPKGAGKHIQFYAHGRMWTPTEFVDFTEGLTPQDVNICIPKFIHCHSKGEYEGIINGGEIYYGKEGHIECSWKDYDEHGKRIV